MRKNKKCTGHNCWFCRNNRKAETTMKDCSCLFVPMYNNAVARRLYDEKRYYNPEWFMWDDPFILINQYKRYVNHHVILLGKSGDFRSGEVIEPYSAPTKYPVLSQKNIWIRYSKCPDMVLVYPFLSIVAFIDMETYWNKRETHPYRVVMDLNAQPKYFRLESNLPF